MQQEDLLGHIATREGWAGHPAATGVDDSLLRYRPEDTHRGPAGEPQAIMAPQRHNINRPAPVVPSLIWDVDNMFITVW